MGWRSNFNEFYMFFRRSCLRLQQRFCRIAPVQNMPRVFLHGNPHLDNYAKTLAGEGMIDFDRSRMGPYAWDITRFLCSLSFKRQEPSKKFLPNRTLRYFLEAYLDGFTHPFASFSTPELLKSEKPTDWQKSTAAYLDKNMGWAKKLRGSPLSPTHYLAQNFLKLYAQSRRDTSLLTDYTIEEAGLGVGSLGKPRLLIVLAPQKDKKKRDKILLDIKEVYADPDNRHFFNPFVHHGLRMIEASHLYAPGMEQRLGYFTWKGSQFWGRQVPSFKGKIKGFLSDDQLCDIAITVAIQLGKAHRRSLRDASSKEMVRHLKSHYEDYARIAESLNEELYSAWLHYHRHHAPSPAEVRERSLRKNEILKRILQSSG